MYFFNSLTKKYFWVGLVATILTASFIITSFWFTSIIENDAKRVSVAGSERIRLLKIEMLATMAASHLSHSFAETTYLTEIGKFEESLMGFKYGNPAISLKACKNKGITQRVSKLIDEWTASVKPELLAAGTNIRVGKPVAINKLHVTINSYCDDIDDLTTSIVKRSDRQFLLHDKIRLTLLASVIIFFVMGIYFTESNLVLPLKRLLRAATDMEQGRLDVRVAAKSSDEIGQLSQKFNSMAHTLQIYIDENSRRMNQLDQMNKKAEEMVNDATHELQLTNRELIIAKEMADAANRAKSQFLANMSHELRTPLNAIIGFSEMLKMGIAGELQPDQQEYINDIFDSGHMLLSLISDILDLSKIEADKHDLKLVDVDVRTAIERVINLFKEKTLKRNLSLSTIIHDGVHTVYADERRLGQVISNLLSNAVKFTPNGGEITVGAVIINTNGRQLAEIYVKDTGPGVKAEDLPKLFTEFQQLDTTEELQHMGTGLGLALSKKLIEAQGGTIRVESQWTKGAEFRFTIPVKKQLEAGFEKNTGN
ncbi:ATP-binding protein [Candidatus Magnetominusculus dajiuhuensis]|uniref:ATP-binding protein n=1 Tax=Candidatus Magnetominusculus dajiuhuensis TaxID=3137712 RepID=UPI003B4314C4